MISYLTTPHLHIFYQAAITRDVRTTARQSGLSSSDVVRIIHKIEQGIGRRLIKVYDLCHSTLELTQAGRNLSESLRLFFKPLEENATAQASVVPKEGKTILRMYCPPSLRECWVSKVIEQFQVTHPEIQITLQSAPSVPRHLSGGFHLYITPFVTKEKNMVCKPLCEYSSLLNVRPITHTVSLSHLSSHKIHQYIVYLRAFETFSPLQQFIKFLQEQAQQFCWDTLANPTLANPLGEKR